METLKDRLKHHLKQSGLNPTSLAKKAGLSMTSVRDILAHADPKPRIDTFIKLCRALEIRPHQLSSDIERLYSPRQIKMLNEITDLDAREKRLVAVPARNGKKKDKP